MKRATKKERQENARKIYKALLQSYHNRIAVMVNRTDSSNSNVSRCQFLAVNPLSGSDKPIVFAESNWGITGCVNEFISSFYDGVQKGYFEEGFREWLLKTLHFRITYNDGYILMLEAE